MRLCIGVCPTALHHTEILSTANLTTVGDTGQCVGYVLCMWQDPLQLDRPKPGAVHPA